MPLDPSSTSSESFPRWFGDYVLLKSLGRGGMGQVFLARLPGLQGIERLCVIKTLRTQYVQDREYVSRFVDEARIVVQLAHRNICPVFDVGSVLGTYYLAMDLVPGRDLTAVFAGAQAARRTMPTDIALFIGIEIVDALDAAHRLVDPDTDVPVNLVHRDVSPHNVLCSFDGEVKLIDFGLAHSSLKHERTEPGIVLGKLAYMAPEHARGEPVDRRADLFAVGVVLYELLVGERYWEGLSTEDVWRVVGHGTHRPARLLGLPDGVRLVLQRALQPQPQDRFATGAELRQALVQTQLARGVVVGSAELRTFLEELFPGAAAADRKERAALARLPAPQVAALDSSVRIASAPGANAPALPPSGRPAATSTPAARREEPIASDDDPPTLQQQPGDIRTESDRSAAAGEPRAPGVPVATELLRRPPSKTPRTPAAAPITARKHLPALAAAAVVVVVAVAVFVGVAPGAAATNDAPRVPIAADGSHAGDTLLPVTLAEAFTDVGEVVPLEAVADPAPAPPMFEPLARPKVPMVEPNIPMVEPLARLKVPLEPLAPRGQPRSAAPRATPAKPAEPTTDLPAAAEMPRGVKPKMQLLTDHCGRFACSGSVQQRFKTFDDMAPVEVGALLRAVDACLETCRKSR